MLPSPSEKLTICRLVSNVSARLRSDRRFVSTVVDALFDEMREAVIEGRQVVMQRIGTFAPYMKNGYQYKLPGGKEWKKAPPMRRLRFVPSVALREDMNAV